jgi:hypothetical protein
MSAGLAVFGSRFVESECAFKGWDFDVHLRAQKWNMLRPLLRHYGLYAAAELRMTFM